MEAATDERNRILDMIEAGQITAVQAAQLLDALVTEYEQPAERVQNRTLRIWMSDTTTRRKKMNVTATMPINLISMSLHLLARLAPQLHDNTIDNVIRAIERGATGRLLDLQDLEEGKRIEIFVEK
jgi:DUF4097 and DUF4098 domain-containing protein YvlB